MAGIGVDFSNEEEVKEYLQNTEIEFMYGCEKENSSDSCARLGNFLESVRSEFKKAADVYKSCCDTYRNPMCCFKNGQYHMLGKGGLDKDVVSAFRCYRTGCIQNKTTDEGKNDRIAANCCNMGLLLMHHTNMRQQFLDTAKEKVDYSRADSKVEVSKNDIPKNTFEAFKRSCELKDSIGCNLLSQMYMSGYEDQCKKNWKLSAHYAEKACDLGHPAGCHNLAIMHERGEGVPKDLKKADELKARKKELVDGSVSLQFGAQ